MSERHEATRTVNWEVLRRLAVGMVARSYSPYSCFAVGAAGLGADGALVCGTNVENASYGLTLCAECSLVSDLVGRGESRLLAVCIVGYNGEALSPCGRCRQLLYEFGGAAILVDQGEGVDPVTLGELLPGAFSRDDLDVGSEQ